MVTRAEYLAQHLPEAVAIKAIANMSKFDYMHGYTEAVASKERMINETVLFHAFEWARTPEGADYWVAVNREYFIPCKEVYIPHGLDNSVN